MWYDAAAHRLVVESDVARGKLLAVEGLDSATPRLENGDVAAGAHSRRS